MKRNICIILGVFVVLLTCGCNILPKSVQYQNEEEKLIGSTDVINPVVEEIQVVLKGLGYDTETTDGRMGGKTREAIKEFQESMGLKSTGYINKLTLSQIDEIRRANDERESRESKDAYKIEVRSAYPEKLGTSSSGLKPTTKEIQTALKNAGFDPGAIDGKMGKRTQQAIKEFQRAKALKVDGVVGPKTWGELGKYLKK